MKAVTKANWVFRDIHGIDGLFQKFTRAVRVVIQEGGYIPPSIAAPCDNAHYIIHCFSREHEEDAMFENDLSFEEHVGGISSVYTGPNGTLSFVLEHRRGVKPKAEIAYAYNQETGTAISLEHLGAMVSILKMPDSFEVGLTDDDMDEILLPRYISNGAAKLGGYS
ncbi:MAG: hypothetical protein WC437_03460 [Patescibacteria group bacterium]